MDLLFQNVQFLDVVYCDEVPMVVEGTISEVVVSLVDLGPLGEQLHDLVEYLDLLRWVSHLEDLLYSLFTIENPLIEPEEYNDVHVEPMVVYFELSQQG